MTVPDPGLALCMHVVTESLPPPYEGGPVPIPSAQTRVLRPGEVMWPGQVTQIKHGRAGIPIQVPPTLGRK